MNSHAPPKKARGKLASKTTRKLIASACYAVLTVLATVFGGPFWFFEQRKSRFADRIENGTEDE